MGFAYFCRWTCRVLHLNSSYIFFSMFETIFMTYGMVQSCCHMNQRESGGWRKGQNVFKKKSKCGQYVFVSMHPANKDLVLKLVEMWHQMQKSPQNKSQYLLQVTFTSDSQRMGFFFFFFACLWEGATVYQYLYL